MEINGKAKPLLLLRLLPSRFSPCLSVSVVKKSNTPRLNAQAP
jgi:hypothetical protein